MLQEFLKTLNDDDIKTLVESDRSFADNLATELSTGKQLIDPEQIKEKFVMKLERMSDDDLRGALQNDSNFNYLVDNVLRKPFQKTQDMKAVDELSSLDTTKYETEADNIDPKYSLDKPKSPSFFDKLKDRNVGNEVSLPDVNLKDFNIGPFTPELAKIFNGSDLANKKIDNLMGKYPALKSFMETFVDNAAGAQRATTAGAIGVVNQTEKLINKILKTAHLIDSDTNLTGDLKSVFDKEMLTAPGNEVVKQTGKFAGELAAKATLARGLTPVAAGNISSGAVFGGLDAAIENKDISKGAAVGALFGAGANVVNSTTKMASNVLGKYPILKVFTDSGDLGVLTNITDKIVKDQGLMKAFIGLGVNGVTKVANVLINSPEKLGEFLDALAKQYKKKDEPINEDLSYQDIQDLEG